MTAARALAGELVARRALRAVLVERPAPRDDVHRERLRTRDDLEADRPEADDTDRGPVARRLPPVHLLCCGHGIPQLSDKCLDYSLDT